MDRFSKILLDLYHGKKEFETKPLREKNLDSSVV